jgi:glycosyltransferase involved in cell wall biosynthesis
LERPYFSIILPTYNAGLTIQASVKSILSQSFKDFELLIIDGLSTDNTLALAPAVASDDTRLKCFSEADEGIYDAMNKGIDRAKGKWIYFIGADDSLLNSDVLQNVADYITANNQGMVFYGNVLISGDTNWAYDGQIYDGSFTLNKLIQRNICHQAIFYNLDFIRNGIGFFNKKYVICADWDFNLRCWSKSSFIFMGLIIAQFNAGGESTLTFEDLEFSNDLIPNLLSYFKISPFNEIVNQPDFPQAGKLLVFQKRNSYPRYILDRIKKKIIQ